MILAVIMALVFVSRAAAGGAGDTQAAGDLPTAGALQSAGALEFGPDGVLFVGDSYGAKVFAFQTNDITAPAVPEAPVLVERIDVALAALLGANPLDIVINDMAVNPLSQNVYLTVHVGRSTNPGVALARLVKDSGELEILDLSQFPMTSVDIPLAPAFEETLQYGQSERMLSVTDLTYYNGELLIAGVSNQEFESTLRRVSYPFTDAMSISSIEIFHGAHNQQETHAPIVTSLVYEIEGEAHLIAGYACAPLVKIPLAALQDGAHVMGTTMAELGYGNAPVDIFVYQPHPMLGGGNERILVTNDQRGATSVDTALFAEAELTEGAFFPTGLNQSSQPLTGALHADPLNDAFLVTVRRNVQTGYLNLNSVPMGLWFDAAETIVEMNWPDRDDSPAGSPNPIDYGFEG